MEQVELVLAAATGPAGAGAGGKTGSSPVPFFQLYGARREGAVRVRDCSAKATQCKSAGEAQRDDGGQRDAASPPLFSTIRVAIDMANEGSSSARSRKWVRDEDLSINSFGRRCPNLSTPSGATQVPITRALASCVRRHEVVAFGSLARSPTTATFVTPAERVGVRSVEPRGAQGG